MSAGAYELTIPNLPHGVEVNLLWKGGFERKAYAAGVPLPEAQRMYRDVLLHRLGQINPDLFVRFTGASLANLADHIHVSFMPAGMDPAHPLHEHLQWIDYALFERFVRVLTA